MADRKRGFVCLLKIGFLVQVCVQVTGACVTLADAGPRPLAEAVRAAAEGDAPFLRQWVAEGGNPDQADEKGWTPLLMAAVRGKAAAVDALLNNQVRKADTGVRFAPSGALPIHLAGQSGDLETARLLLAARPGDLDEVWLLNGHTLLLQAAFYGHVKLAEFALGRGANPAATTLRGLTAMDFARQFDNRALMAALAASEPSPERKSNYYKALLDRVREPVPAGQEEAQRRSDEAATAIADAIRQAGADPGRAPALVEDLKKRLAGVDVNRLAGDLLQPLLVVAVTGPNGGPHPESAAELRAEIVRLLLDRGADPVAKEKHPMGAHAIIRASVFGHLDILKLMGSRVTSAQLAGALNEIPAVNGLTALHDAVLRAGTAEASLLARYLGQIRWEVASGARGDIEDFSGRTQRQYAEAILDSARRRAVLEALDPTLPMPQWAHAAVGVPALEPAMRWYSDVFGFLPLTEPKVHTPEMAENWSVARAIFGDGLTRVRFVRMRVPDAPFKQTIELFELTPTPATGEAGKRKTGYVHTCLVVGDVDTVADRIENRGGKILSASTFNHVQIIFCQDPYGNIIELASAPW